MKLEYKLIFVVLFFTNFMGIIHLPNALLLAILLPVLLWGIQKKMPFKYFFIIIFLGLILNMFSSNYYRGQSIIHTLKAMPGPYYLGLFYVLYKMKPSLRVLESSIYKLIFIFDMVYIIQFILLQYGISFVLGAGEGGNDYMEVRMRLPAGAFSSLGIFYSVNKIVKSIKVKQNLVLLLLSFTVIILMGFRTMIFLSLFFSFVLLYKLEGINTKTLKAIIFIFVLLVVMYYYIPAIQIKFDGMWERQFGDSAQTLNNDEYIRNITLYYYTQDHFKSPLEYILGCGAPFVENVRYFKEFDYRQEILGIYWVDWGLLGLSWMIGIIPVIGMVGYSLKSLFLKVSSKYYYLGIWFLYLVMSSITTMEFFRTGNFVVQALCLYAVYLANTEILINENRNHYLSQSV